MAEPTPEQIAMARRIAEETRIDGPLGLGPPNAVKAALAAIIETQRICAELVDSMTLEMPGISIGLADGASLARRQIVTAIRAGKHYGKDQQ